MVFFLLVIDLYMYIISALQELIQGTTDSQMMDIAEDPEYMIM
jgi:hypothetical protein